jgi:hypothetical protein
MSADPEQAAEDAIADLLQKARNRSAVCAALMRLAGQALAGLTSHDQASSLHAQLARRHALRATRGPRGDR